MMWFFLIAGLVGITISCQSYFPQENDDNAKNRISGVEGTVIAESDVMFESDMVMTDQLVLIFPQEATSSLVGRKVDSSELRFLRETISELNEGIETTLTDNDGQFSFFLPPGYYVLCLADLDEQTSDSFPITTRGCGQVMVQSNIMRQVNISSGFGEILLIEP